MTDIRDIIRAVLPDATDRDCEDIVWAHRPYPARPLTARMVWHAAHRVARAQRHGWRLCVECDQLAMSCSSLCLRCACAIEDSLDDE
jgi:hypothetical protein